MLVLLKGITKAPGNAFRIYAVSICFVSVYRKCMRDLMLRLVPLILHLLFFFSGLKTKVSFFLSSCRNRFYFVNYQGKVQVNPREWGGGVLPYKGYIGMCY